ncbi:MAG: pseudouridine-5'-phosphate glycosidase [Eubacteriales bacterium]|nr:pseudouridine-5'-phosphate glycosidase [Eubacteriales bacterium]
MGKIASDFYQSFIETEETEISFSAQELLRMASADVQEEFAGWMTDDDDSMDYIPGDLLIALLRDRAFFAELMMMREVGEPVILSGISMGFTPDHIDNMGLRIEDVSENIVRFLENEEGLSYSIRGAMSGNRGRISAIYIFANGWFGVETESIVDESWKAEAGIETNPDEIQFEPATSYLFSDEGDLVATPDIHYDVDAWMDFVDLFSAVHEEASAADAIKSSGEEPEEAGRSYIVFSEEVQEAIREGRPIVAVESAATFGAMIYPGIAEFAFHMRDTIRKNGAVPAFTAIIHGQIHIGLTDDEIRYLEANRGTIFKASMRDIPILVAKRADGVMTIAAAVQVAAMVGLTIVSGSGIGGAQLGAELTMDISNDLKSVSSNNVMVVCSGTKPILDLPITMEYLETQGVPVIGYGTDRMPEYMVRGSGFRLTYRMETPEELAEVMKIKAKMGIPGGVLVVNPVPKEYEMDPIRTRKAVDMAMQDVKTNNVRGKAITPYMMGRIKVYLGQESVDSQKAFLINNAILAAKIAAAMRKS